MDTPGSLFVVSAPSGAGKSTLVKLLLECDRRVRHSVSCTTRAPRPGEQDGREYHFVDIPAFCAMRDRGESRDQGKWADAMARIEQGWSEGKNMVPVIMDALENNVTMGECHEAMRKAQKWSFR